MRFPLPNEEEGQIVTVAFLKAVADMSVAEIASATGLSTATINRRLKDATAADILRRLVFSPDEELVKKYGHYFRNLNLEEKINAYLGKILINNAIVVPSTGEEAENRRKVAKVAAFQIFEKLKSADKPVKIGISWGRTLKETADAIKEIKQIEGALGMEKKRPSKADYSSLEFLPLCGDFWFSKEMRARSHFYSSTRLAADLSDCFGSIPPVEMSVPAYIPEEFAAESKIQEFLYLSPGMRRLYDGEQPLIDRLDGIITSVGYYPKRIPDAEERDDLQSSSTLIILSEHMDRRRLQELESEGVIGDILGYFITKEETPAGSVVEKINSLFLGPKPKHFRKCSERARNDNNVGVIIIASGKEKAAVLRNVIQNGYVNEVIIDSNLAEELMASFGISPD